MKRRIAPPLRLAWPDGGNKLVSNSSSLLHENIQRASKSSATGSFHYKKDGYAAGKRRGRGSMNDANSKSKQERTKSMMWTEKHAPLTSSELCVQPKKVKECKEWIESRIRGKNDCCGKLLILTGGPGVGKSTLCRVLISEMNLRLLEWDESQDGAMEDGGGFRNRSQISSFSDFLNAATSFPSLKTQSDFNNGRTNGNVVLIDELPNLYGLKSEQSFRTVMKEFILRAAYPAILICSEASEGKVKSSTLEKLIDADILHSQLVDIIHINPATKPKLKKACERIANRERKSIPSSLIEKFFESSGGDMRSATMALQFSLTGRKRYKLNDNHVKDLKLSSFHALGKLLYAKRIHTPHAQGMYESHTRPPLSFVPEDVMKSSEMRLNFSTDFLAYHCPSFFTKEEELSDALATFSDAAVMMQKEFDSSHDRSDSVFPSEYVCSFASRAVAVANKHPAPNTFRQFCAPKMYKVRHKRNENIMKIERLVRSLILRDGSLTLHTNLMASKYLHEIAYLSRIIPNEVNDALASLSTFSSSHNVPTNDEPIEEKAALAEQRKILALDDIVEYD